MQKSGNGRLVADYLAVSQSLHCNLFFIALVALSLIVMSRLSEPTGLACLPKGRGRYRKFSRDANDRFLLFIKRSIFNEGVLRGLKHVSLTALLSESVTWEKTPRWQQQHQRIPNHDRAWVKYVISFGFEYFYELL